MTSPSTTDQGATPPDPAPTAWDAWATAAAPAAAPAGPHGSPEHARISSNPGRSVHDGEGEPDGGALDTAGSLPRPTWPAPPPNPSPRWARWALAGLLAATAVLYLWALDRNGWANAYYSAAAQAAGSSWKAWFFGGLDAGNSITVDKTPAAIWLMGASVRLFGLSSWSVLVPQALLGVATVGVLHAAVRRWFGAPAGLIAGAVLAVTPVATLMFRFNNPDALLVFLLVCAAWAMGRATERGGLRWIALAGGFVGLAFLAKMMQALLVLPGFVAMYAVAAPVGRLRRIGHLLVALGAMVAAAGWWVAVVVLWPASARPWIGGSQNNSIIELTLGYNGFGRLTGNETGSVVPGAGQGAGGLWGETGLYRLFNSSYGGQASWLLPAALVMIGVLLWVTRRSARTDLTRAAVLGWGGWLLVTAAAISFGEGIIHEYYTVALAPAIGALVGIGAMELWAHRAQLWSRLVAAATVAGSAWWAATLLGRSAGFVPWLATFVLLSGLLAAGTMLVVPLLPATIRRVAAAGAGVTALLLLLAGPAAYSLETATTSASGSLPSAGPTVAGARGGPGIGRGGPPGRQPPGQGTDGGAGQRPGLPGGAQPPGLPGNAANPGTGQLPGGTGGSLLQGSTPGEAVTATLLEDADSFTWVAASVGANSAAGYQLATQRPVMAIGGFNGSDPSPSLAQFQQYVAEGRIHWFISGGMGGGAGGGMGGGAGGGQMGGTQAASQITAWVQQSFTATTIDGITLYDLSAASPSTSAATAASTTTT